MRRIVTTLVVVAAAAALFTPAAAAAKAPGRHQVETPVVVRFVATPRILPLSGGTIRIEVTARQAAHCLLSASPPLAGFPRPVRCIGGLVRVSERGATVVPRQVFSLVATSPGHRVVRRAVVIARDARGKAAPTRATAPTTTAPTTSSAPAPVPTTPSTIPTSATLPPPAPSTTLRVVTTALPTVQPGVAYWGWLVAAGGTPPYTWTIVSGRLPFPLMLSADGAVFGSPSAQSVPPILVQVTDAAGRTAEALVSIPVA